MPEKNKKIRKPFTQEEFIHLASKDKPALLEDVTNRVHNLNKKTIKIVCQIQKEKS